jgi:predicted Zn-dependent protease
MRVGYDPNGLVEMLNVMKKNLKAGGLDFAKTHPAPDDRIAEIQKKGPAQAAVKVPAPRQTRFLKALGNI